MNLTSQRYGKERVRVLRVERHPSGRHDVREIEASVMLEGDFANTYLTGDNSKVVATDTMKNIVQALAQRHLGDDLEEFALTLGRHFLDHCPQVARATIEIFSRPWDRYQSPDGEAHPHAFGGRTSNLPFSRIVASRDKLVLQSGVRKVLVLKSTASAFVGFPRCGYTTLPETNDRIMATEMEATWTFSGPGVDYRKANTAILSALLETYAREFSPSLQNTLFLMGKAALEAAPDITDIHLAMPNKHYLPVNLKPFGLENNNEIFLPTDEPHGQIEALISR